MPRLVPILLLLFCAPVWAQTTSSTTSIDASKKSKEPSKLSTILDVTMTTDSQQVGEDKSTESSIWLFVNYKISDLYRANLWLSTNKDLSSSYENTVGDTRLTFFRKGTKLTEKLTLTPSVGLVLPTSETSKRNQEMIGGIELNPAFGYNATNKLSFSYLPRLGRYFHEYTTTRTNDVNVQYRLIQFIGTNYQFNDKWSAGGTLIYTNSWSYLGTRRDPNYLSILSVGYGYSRDLSFSVGVMTGGTLQDRANGPDQTVEIFDENVASYFGNVTYRF